MLSPANIRANVLVKLGELTGKTHALPLVLFSPTARCNSRCVSCDWWRSDGAGDLSDIAALSLRRDQTAFSGRFRLFEVMDWSAAGAKGSPLPPLSGTLTTPKLEVSGAVLEGVELQMEDPAIPMTRASE